MQLTVSMTEKLRRHLSVVLTAQNNVRGEPKGVAHGWIQARHFVEVQQKMYLACGLVGGSARKGRNGANVVPSGSRIELRHRKSG